MSGDDPNLSLPAFGFAEDAIALLEAQLAKRREPEAPEAPRKESAPPAAPLPVAAPAAGAQGAPTARAVEKIDPRSPTRIVEFAGLFAEAEEQEQVREREYQLLSFVLAGEEYALSIAHAREIVRVGALTRIPEAPEHVRGVMNLRGRILPIIELRGRLGLSPLELGKDSRVIVVDAYGRQLGLLVDQVNRIIKVPESSLRAPPDEIRAPLSDYISAVVHLPERLALLLDAEKVLLLPSRTSEPKP